MEETLQQEQQETEYQNPNDDQGGIRRRLRDRDLLRKRKAEAEEKETYQEETQRKRSRVDEKSGSKRRGRPRKSEPRSGIPVIQEEAAFAQEYPAVVVLPEPVGILSEEASGSLTPSLAAGGDKLESQPESLLADPASNPVLGSGQSSVAAPVLTSPAPVNQTPALVSPSVSAPSSANVLDSAPVAVQAPAPAPDAVPVPPLSRAPAPAAAAPAPPRGEALYTESKDREALDQVLIEDLGPDEEEDTTSLLRDKKADEDLTETPFINLSEQNKMFSIPTLSSPTLPQEYLPGN